MEFDCLSGDVILFVKVESKVNPNRLRKLLNQFFNELDEKNIESRFGMSSDTVDWLVDEIVEFSINKEFEAKSKKNKEVRND